SPLDPALRVPVDREVDGHRPRMEDVQRPEIERPAREVDSRRSARFDCQLGPHARRILLNSRGAKDGAGGAYRASSADAADEGRDMRRVRPPQTPPPTTRADFAAGFCKPPRGGGGKPARGRGRPPPDPPRPGPPPRGKGAPT